MFETGKVVNDGQWQVGEHPFVYCKLKNNCRITIEMAGSSEVSFAVFHADGRFMEKNQMIKVGP